MRIREPFTLGQTKPYNVAGNFIRLKAATGLTSGSVDVKLWYRGQSLPVDMLAVDPGDWVRVPGAGFDYVEVLSTVAQTLELQVLRGDVGSDRVTGEVSVIDGESLRSLSGVAFMSAPSRAAVAGQYSHVQLWNPGASGKNAFVEQVTVFASAGAGVLFRRHNAALTTLHSNPSSKLLGGAASALEAREQTNAAVLGTAYADFGVPAGNTAFPYRFTKPVVIPPGQGLVVVLTTVNLTMSANFEHWEQSV